MIQVINRKQIYPTFSDPKTFACPISKNQKNDKLSLFSIHILDFEINESELSKVLSLNNKITNYIVNDGTKVVGYIVNGEYISYSINY